MVSLSYGGCCVRGLYIIEAQRAKREGAAAVGRRLPKRNNKDPQHPQQRDADRQHRDAAPPYRHLFVNTWRRPDVKSAAKGGINCEEG